MKRFITFWFAAFAITLPVTAQNAGQQQQTEQQSLADLARQTKPRAGTQRHSFTNDDLPHDGVANVIGVASPAATEKSDAAKPGMPGSKDAASGEKALADQKKPSDELQKKIS